MNIKKIQHTNFFYAVLFCNLFVAAKAEVPNFGLFVEPAITYERSDSSANFPTPLSNSSGSINGFGIGGKLGIHLFDAFFIGIDGRYSRPHFLDSSINYDAYGNAMNWGLFAGIQVPTVGMRVWAGPVLGGILDPKESGNFDIKLKNSSGYRVGTGFRVAQVSLNLEYQHINYKEVLLEKVGLYPANTSLSNTTFENNSWIASISFPIEL